MQKTQNTYNFKERGNAYGAAAALIITRKDVNSIALKPMTKYEYLVHTKCPVMTCTTANTEAARVVQQQRNLSHANTLNP
jgi:hypothetical protein